MLSERDIERAHPEAFDFIFGNLPPDHVAEFNEHLGGCRYCQCVVAEYSEIGRIIHELPPHVEPPADLEDRTVAAMRRALRGQPAVADQRPRRDDLPATRTYQVLQGATPPDAPTANTQAFQAVQEAPAPVTRLARCRGRRRGPVGLWLAAAAAAVLIVVGVVILRPGGGSAPPQAAVVTPLHATAAAKVFGVGAATGRATARQVGESWTFELDVHGLKSLPGGDFYECWWAGPGSSRLHPILATGGSFVVGKSGSATLTMTTGVDPREFRTMEITAESPGNGGLHGTVLLTGQTL
jgi:hypothetical protein